MIGRRGSTLVEINWIANPWRAESFAEAWKGPAEAVLDYGATGYAFVQSTDDPQHFTQFALFESKLDFERYWYSEEIVAARIAATGLFQIPIQPVWYQVLATGELAREPAA